MDTPGSRRNTRSQSAEQSAEQDPKTTLVYDDTHHLTNYIITPNTELLWNLKPLSNPKNSCFANTAIQAICWLARQGSLRFIIEDWNIISTHTWIATEDKHFIRLFKMLLFDDPPAKITAQIVHRGLFELQSNSRRDKENNGLLDKICITKVPTHQEMMESAEVFDWLYTCLWKMSGNVQFTFKVL